jgi:hypothetical protein
MSVVLHDHSEQTWKEKLLFVVASTIMIVVMVAVGFTVSWAINYSEIESKHYSEVVLYKSQFPEITPVIERAMMDGSINRCEFRDICKEALVLREERLKPIENWDIFDE